jgi:hypothetical protein
VQNTISVSSLFRTFIRSPVACVERCKGKRVSLLRRRGYGAAARLHPDGGAPGSLRRRALCARRVFAPPPGPAPPRRAAPGGRVPRRGPAGLRLLRHPPGRRGLLLRVARRVQGRAPRRRARTARPRPARAPVRLHRGAPRQARAPSRSGRRQNSDVTQGQIVAVPRFVRGQGRRHRGPPPPLPVQAPATPVRAPRPVRRPHVLLLGPAPPLHRGSQRRAGHGSGAAVRPAVSGIVAARFLGPAVEPDGVRCAPAGGLRPRARARREGDGRSGHVPRVRADARGHSLLRHLAPAHGGDDRVLPAPRRVLRRRGAVRAVVGGEGVGASAPTRGHARRTGVRVRHCVLAVLPAVLQERRGGHAAGGVGRGGELLRRRPANAAPVRLVRCA